MKGWASFSVMSAALAAAIALAGCGNRAADASAANESANAASASAGAIERGRYLVAIMDCAGCHNTGAFSPHPEQGYLEGGTIGFEVPGLGVFYPPNLTPHPDAGIGRWSEAEIVATIRTGRRPDGRELAPAMPWHAYSRLTDADAAAAAAYLKSLPPSDHRVPGPATPQTAPAPYLTVRTPAVAR